MYLNKLPVPALFLFLIFGLYHSASAQVTGDFLTHTVQSLSKQTATLPVEKAYLQFDKPFYTAGDEIWFKGYVTIGVLHRPSVKGDILNAQLINSDGKVIQFIKMPLTNGLCSGEFALPDTLKPDTYQIRAYTNYMLNFGNDFCFSKNIVIQNPLAEKVITKATYNYTIEPTARKLNIRVNYTDINGRPYAGKDVRYIINRGKHLDIISKITTDNNGDVLITYALRDTLPVFVNTTMTMDRKSIVKNVTVNPKLAQYDVQFFPESGYLVNGVKSKVGFKTIGLNGLGVNLSGIVENSSHKQVASFKSTHVGMGRFDFTPEDGQVYKAVITTPTGQELLVNLPLAHKNGYVLALDNTTDTSFVKLTLSGKNTGPDSVATLGLVAQAVGVPCYATLIKVTNLKPVTISVPAQRFPSGVVQFTLISASHEPINERIVFFHHKNDQLNLNISSDKKSYQPRSAVTLNLNSTDIAGVPIAGNFSAAVINDGAINADQNAENTIFSTLLLTSNLKGNIEQPGYYFNEANKDRDANLDLLMLTQGYRSISWRKILSGEIQQPIYKPEKAVTISGYLKTLSGKPVPMGKVRLLTTTGKAIKLDTISDSQGKFAFHNLIFRDSTKFVLQANASNGKSTIIVAIDTLQNYNALDAGTIASADTVPISYLQSSKERYNEDVKYNVNNRTILLKEVKITTVRPELKHSANLNGPGRASQVVSGNVIRERGCATLSDCLMGQLKGVIIGADGVPRAPQSNNTFSAGIKRSPMAPPSTGSEMLVMVDGVAVDSGIDSPLNLINPADVASVELLLDPGDLVIYGMQGHNGIILINTRRGDEPGPQPYKATNNLPFFPKGYYVEREFYSPVYDVNTIVHPDLRTTIFWKPNIFTDAKGNAQFSFFNADGKGTYRVLVEGIDSDGRIGHKIYNYTVE